MIELTLEQKLINARAGLNKCINKSYKTGMKAQASMISIYRKRVEELEKQIEKLIQEGK